jgi:hypothetical protein
MSGRLNLLLSQADGPQFSEAVRTLLRPPVTCAHRKRNPEEGEKFRTRAVRFSARSLAYRGPETNVPAEFISLKSPGATHSAFVYFGNG